MAFAGWIRNDDWGLISMLVHRSNAEMREVGLVIRIWVNGE